MKFMSLSIEGEEEEYVEIEKIKEKNILSKKKHKVEKLN